MEHKISNRYAYHLSVIHDIHDTYSQYKREQGGNIGVMSWDTWNNSLIPIFM